MSKNWFDSAAYSGVATASDQHEDLQMPDQTSDQLNATVVEEQADVPQIDFSSPFPSEYRVVEVKKYRLKK